MSTLQAVKDLSTQRRRCVFLVHEERRDEQIHAEKGSGSEKFKPGKKKNQAGKTDSDDQLMAARKFTPWPPFRRTGKEKRRVAPESPVRYAERTNKKNMKINGKKKKNRPQAVCQNIERFHLGCSQEGKGAWGSRGIIE